jgi:hypothetical protein
MEVDATVAHDAMKSPVRTLLWQSISDPSGVAPFD